MIFGKCDFFKNQIMVVNGSPNIGQSNYKALKIYSATHWSVSTTSTE